MKQIIKQLGFTVASVVMVLGLAAAPVSAHRGSDDDSSHDSTSSNDDNSGSGSSGTSSNSGRSGHGGNTLAVETESEDAADDSGGHSGSLRKQAQDLLKTKRKEGKEHSREQRQKNINKRATNFTAAAERHLAVFDKIFTKVQAFHDAKNLNVTDYDTLVAAATTKQTAAQTAVDALKALDVELDCTQSDPASTVAQIKSAVANARKALKEYRASIKDLTVALKGASTAQNTTESEGGDQ